MLGYIQTKGAGVADALLADLAERLESDGLRVAGAVQINTDLPDRDRCAMDLHVLTGDHRIRISQDLGTGARGCRLDPAALEEAVRQVEDAVTGTLQTRPQILLINKFGKTEAEGRGFRPVIGSALAADIPVLIAVGESQTDAFLSFVGGMATLVDADPKAVADWCKTVVA